MKVLDNIFMVCIIVGFALPILNLIFGFLGGIGGHLDLNFDGEPDFDVNVGHDAFLGFNFMSLMLALAVFGLIGKFLANRIYVIFAVLIAIACSLTGYMIMYRMVFQPLKRNRELVLTQEMRDLIGKPGKLILPITPKSFGTVRTTDNTGALITYMATAEPEEFEKYHGILPKDMDVAIVDVNEEKKYCVVRIIDF